MKHLTIYVLISFILLGCSKQYDFSSYEGQLAALQSQYKPFHAHAPRFFLFGMGNRDKFIYKDYKLTSIENHTIISFVDEAISDSIIPDEYRIKIRTKNGVIQIIEDENAVWFIKDGSRKRLSKKTCHLNLPTFDEFKYGKVLRVLHHELLFNIRDSRIYPNIFVYHAPFYRDAFMAALCLERTKNTHLIISWLQNICSIYDMQNREPEADNLGELLYLLSFIPKDYNTVLRHNLLKEIYDKALKKDNYLYIKGHTDGADNAEYQTQILKMALKKNDLEDQFTNPPPQEVGAYYNLCWFTQGSDHIRNLSQLYRDFRFNYEDSPFPYLQWARAHYYNDYKAPFNMQRYPLSWEKRGGSAHFEGMHIISDKAVEERISYPHVWTAAEMFLKLYEER